MTDLDSFSYNIFYVFHHLQNSIRPISWHAEITISEVYKSFPANAGHRRNKLEKTADKLSRVKCKCELLKREVDKLNDAVDKIEIESSSILAKLLEIRSDFTIAQRGHAALIRSIEQLHEDESELVQNVAEKSKCAEKQGSNIEKIKRRIGEVLRDIEKLERLNCKQFRNMEDSINESVKTETEMAMMEQEINEKLNNLLEEIENKIDPLVKQMEDYNTCKNEYEAAEERVKELEILLKAVSDEKKNYELLIFNEGGPGIWDSVVETFAYTKRLIVDYFRPMRQAPSEESIVSWRHNSEEEEEYRGSENSCPLEA